MIEVPVSPSITPEQRKDPRFIEMLQEAREYFNSRHARRYLSLLALHEAGHAYFAKKSGATDVQFHGPMMMWDSRAEYNRPAISRASTWWIPAPEGSVVAAVKAHLGGFVCRREMSDTPNDEIAIGTDIDGCRNWWMQHKLGSEEIFQAALAKAEAEIMQDLKSPAVRAEIQAEANRFMKEIFPEPKPTWGMLGDRREGGASVERLFASTSHRKHVTVFKNGWPTAKPAAIHTSRFGSSIPADD
jgi:hypothetical protein